MYFSITTSIVILQSMIDKIQKQHHCEMLESRKKTHPKTHANSECNEKRKDRGLTQITSQKTLFSCQCSCCLVSSFFVLAPRHRRLPRTRTNTPSGVVDELYVSSFKTFWSHGTSVAVFVGEDRTLSMGLSGRVDGICLGNRALSWSNCPVERVSRVQRPQYIQITAGAPLPLPRLSCWHGKEKIPNHCSTTPVVSNHAPI
ncbi:hypothetical protein BDZ45DRAFT_684630 [Acephala macrosclerotiorum]|nr:hypothetical protein BDZ45DRAFT_684630 [Acephala macrosclerotiorum]